MRARFVAGACGKQAGGPGFGAKTHNPVPDLVWHQGKGSPATGSGNSDRRGVHCVCGVLTFCRDGWEARRDGKKKDDKQARVRAGIGEERWSGNVFPRRGRLSSALKQRKEATVRRFGGRAFQAKRTASAKALKSEPVWQIEGQAGLMWVEQTAPGGGW